MSQEHKDQSLHLHDPEIEEALRLQNPQLQLLRELGIAQMIEKETGLEIPQFVFQGDPSQPPKTDLWRTMRVAMPEEGWLSGKWNFLLMIPDAIHKDTPDTTIRVKPSRVVNKRLKEGSSDRFFFDTQTVLIEFTENRYLKVAGDKVTFEGDLTTVNEELLARVQTGIQEAFVNPQTVVGTTEFMLAGKTPIQTLRV